MFGRFAFLFVTIRSNLNGWVSQSRFEHDMSRIRRHLGHGRHADLGWGDVIPDVGE